MRTYWRLPFWMPIPLRNLILSYEPFDRETFEQTCQVIGERRWGVMYLEDDWKLIAAEVCYTASRIGVSFQWLARQWAVCDLGVEESGR